MVAATYFALGDRLDLTGLRRRVATLPGDGPWGAAAISVHSQFAQLRNVLNKENLLSNGELKRTRRPPRLSNT